MADIDYEKLLPDYLRDNPLWAEFAATLNAVFNPNINHPIDVLHNVRSPDTEPYYAGLNMQMLGFRVPLLSFSDAEYTRLMRFLGTFVQTRGASVKFTDFIGFIKNVKFEHIPLWADDIDDINSLSDTPGTALWDGGDWFPTTFYDVAYDMDVFIVDENQVRDIFQVLAPIHLVLRNLIGMNRTSAGIWLDPVSHEIIHDRSTASR